MQGFLTMPHHQGPSESLCKGDMSSNQLRSREESRAQVTHVLDQFVIRLAICIVNPESSLDQIHRLGAELHLTNP